MQVNCNLSDHVKAITVPPSLEAQETIYGVIRRGRRCNRALSPPDISRGHGPRDGNNDSHPQGSSRQRKDRIPRSHPRRGVASPSFLSEKGRCESFVHIRSGLLLVLRSHSRRVTARPSFLSRRVVVILRSHPRRVAASPSFPSETGRRESFVHVRNLSLRSHPRRVVASPSFSSKTGCCESFLPIQDRSLRVFVPIRDGSLRTRPLFTSETGCRGSFIHIRDGSLQRECPSISFSKTQWNNYLFASVAIRPYPWLYE